MRAPTVLFVRPCPTCGKPFKPNNYRMRYCSRACGGMANRVVAPDRTCERCGQTYSWNGVSDRSHFNRRKLCGRHCQLLIRPDATGRDRARRLFDFQPCAVCGSTKQGRGGIGRHHKDGNRLNNVPANIEFLCRAHHLAAHGPIRDQAGRFVGLEW